MSSVPAHSDAKRATGIPAGGSAGAWTVEWHERVETTQALARGRAAGTAIVADEQTAGRGQAERTFASDPGGLYFTAVLPYAGDALQARGFALAVGWALRAALRRVGATQVRLRWPNDLMVGERKVGGILVEQGGPDTLLVGVGLNLTNEPWRIDESLRHTAGRLADAVEGGALPERAQLVARLLRAVGVAHAAFARWHLAGFGPRLNRCWGVARCVVLEVVPESGATERRGWFRGIGANGEVRLRGGPGENIDVPAHHIRRLREMAG